MGELIEETGFASGVFVGQEGDDGHDGLWDFDVAVLPSADGAAVDVEEVGELLDAELGGPSAEVERLGAAEGERADLADYFHVESLEVSAVCERPELLDDIR